MQYSKLILSAAAMIALSACATTQPSLQAGPASFGQAVKANMAAQAIAPTAKQKEDTYIPANRARTRAARKAYEEGEVQEPKSMTTTNGGNQ